MTDIFRGLSEMFEVKVCFCPSVWSLCCRLAALSASVRFLPRWASNPPWQRRLDVIKVCSPSVIRGCVKWALFGCQKRGLLLCIPIIHVNWHTYTQSFAAQMTRAAFSSFGVIYMLFVRLCTALSVLAGNCSESHISNETTHCQARSKKKKTLRRNIIRSCKTGQLYPIDNLQKPTFIGRFSQIKFYCASWAGRRSFCIAFRSLAFIWSTLLHLCDI